MEFHEVANIFPLMTNDELDELADDIKREGLLHPITLHEGKILDGRNRYIACLRIDVEPRYEEWKNGGSPVAYVISENLKRRHLDESQRSMIATKLANMNEGHPTAPIGAVSQSEAASMLNISRRSVQRAKTVVQLGIPELQEAVTQGEVSVSKAAEIARQPAEEQKETVSKLKNPVLYSSDKDEWYTPNCIINRVTGVLGSIQLDPCSNPGKTIPADRYYTKEDDGLVQEWRGRVYMNPPYGNEIPKWIKKLISEYKCGNVPEAVALVPSRTDTAWFRLLRDYPRCFVWGRLKFGEGKTAAPFPSMAIYLGKNRKKFIEAFRDIGDVYIRVESI